jgi:hypothetical protein
VAAAAAVLVVVMVVVVVLVVTVAMVVVVVVVVVVAAAVAVVAAAVAVVDTTFLCRSIQLVLYFSSRCQDSPRCCCCVDADDQHRLRGDWRLRGSGSVGACVPHWPAVLRVRCSRAH